MARTAFITGITGQDGSYLAEFLLGKGYNVWGMIRRSSSFNTGRIDHLYRDPHERVGSSLESQVPDDASSAPARRGTHRGGSPPASRCGELRLVYGDLTDGGALARILNEIEPDEVYNLGAQSHVRVSFDQPEYTADVDALGTLRLLEAVRTLRRPPRFYQAASSEMFGRAVETPQNERTPFYPRSPYGCAKVYAYWQTVNYREAYGLFACNGILFNHESPRRGETFVTRKITRAATRIKLGLQEKLYLGNLEARRDWGYAGDYVQAMWLMLQQERPDDYVIATGQTHSVREFAQLVFDYLGLNLEAHLAIDPRYFRPTEVDVLQGDASKARRVLNWAPTVGFGELAVMMTEADLKLARREKLLAERSRSLKRVGDLPGGPVLISSSSGARE